MTEVGRPDNKESLKDYLHEQHNSVGRHEFGVGRHKICWATKNVEFLSSYKIRAVRHKFFVVRHKIFVVRHKIRVSRKQTVNFHLSFPTLRCVGTLRGISWRLSKSSPDDDFLRRISLRHYEDPHQNYVALLTIKDIGEEARPEMASEEVLYPNQQFLKMQAFNIQKLILRSRVTAPAL
jgi:hypothetical protein